MRREDWARLAAPFPPHALEWRVAEIAREGDGREGVRARLEPVLALAAVRGRLDATAGLDGWSFRWLPWGEAVLCELTVAGTTRSGVAAPARGLPADPSAVAEWALSRAAVHFGLLPPADDQAAYWVDVDPDDGVPLFLPEPVARRTDPARGRPLPDSRAGDLPPASEAGRSGPAVGASVPRDVAPADDAARAEAAPVDATPDEAAPDGAPAADAAADEAAAADAAAADAAADEAAAAYTATDDPRSGAGAAHPMASVRHEGQQVIERLMERLGAEGLGKEAARVVVEHGGYGRTPDEARDLYRKLRALLLDKGAAVP